MNDKKNILNNLDKSSKISIELGCGPNKKHFHAIGIDILDYDCVDIVGDIFDVMEKIPSGSVDIVYTYHFLEHIEEIDKLLNEIYRVLSDSGKLNVIVPHFSNPFYYSDLTHKTSFGLYSFAYYSESSFKRKVPSYKKEFLYKQDSVRLVFKSYPPRYLRHGFKKLFEYLFNINIFMQEFYEENLPYLIPCYEVSYTLSRKKNKL
jgi:SAM-dependent methyltransferase